MSALSEHQGIQDQDPAERLAAALRRIAVGIERREAAAAATQAALDAAMRSPAASQHPIPAGDEAHPAAAADQAGADPAVAANMDLLIARLRAVLDELPAAPPGGSHDGGS